MIKRISLWLRDVLIKKKSMNATRIVAGGFAAIILLGTLLLMLPFASKSGESAGFLNILIRPFTRKLYSGKYIC